MSTELFGYAGKILRINLTDNSISTETVNPDDLKLMLGGVGYAAKILYQELGKGIDPLGPENKLVFATGPLNATRAPGAGRVELCFKSPLTGGWGESSCGGDLAAMLKKAGYDLLIIEGKSNKPVSISINDDDIKIESAQHLCGKTTGEKIKIISDRINDKKVQIAVIGPSGEKLIPFAGVVIGQRAAGRVGAGAVMGSKNLLAITVKGTGEIPIAKPREFAEAVKKSQKIVLNDPGSKGFMENGTTGDIPSCDEIGDFPTKNWRSNSWGKGGELYCHFAEHNLVTNRACFTGCLMPCGRVTHVKSGKWQTPEHEGSEYETVCAFTAFILNEDVDAAVHASYLCNEYGIDTISMGGIIAFAMDCFDNGLITTEDTGGMEIKWGDPDVFIELVKKIALKEPGIGELLSGGTRRAAQKIGKGAEQFAIHVKGLEGPAHDGRSGKALAVSYGTGNRGMCHIHPVEAMGFDCGKKDFGMGSLLGLPDPNDVDRWDEKGKGAITKKLQDNGILPDILVCCKFYIYVGLGPRPFAEMVSALTGWDISPEELLKIGERAMNIQRLFNIREGFTTKDDQLPQRVLNVPEFGKYADIPKSGIKDYHAMLAEYYQERGWDNQTGEPTPQKLKELGLA
jgi:aldehyde:ferredoxin oxidoreductase